ncbi:MAG: hypothetical protein EBT22_04160 [Chloroflexi bacterium]|nr:hypothetical protein [Chloroflexota bacterium]
MQIKPEQWHLAPRTRRSGRPHRGTVVPPFGPASTIETESERQTASGLIALFWDGFGSASGPSDGPAGAPVPVAA